MDIGFSLTISCWIMEVGLAFTFIQQIATGYSVNTMSVHKELLKVQPPFLNIQRNLEPLTNDCMLTLLSYIFTK